MNDVIARWEQILRDISPRLAAFSEQEMNAPSRPGGWSKKEILGHLIDSAANNHNRFVRARIEDTPTIGYDQNEWVAAQNYAEEETAIVLNLWKYFNTHLLHVIKNIAPSDWQRTSRLRNGEINTLEFLARDYLHHMEHHLAAIISDYEFIEGRYGV